MTEPGNGDFEHERFENMQLEPGDSLDASFVECTFSSCSFNEAKLRHCHFNSCVFQGCDLSLSDITGSSFPSTQFENSKLLGINWTRASWSALSIGRPPVFDKCLLNHSTFINLNLKGCRIVESTAREVDFRGADLSGASFRGTDLAGSLFNDTDLQGADFRGAYGYDIDPLENQLKGARFDLPEAIALLYSMDISLDDAGSM